MGTFDKLAGLDEGCITLERSPLKTLGEAGGDVKSTPDTTVDYGDPPPPFKAGTPNSAYRAQPKQDYGSDKTMAAGKEKKSATRTGKPAQFNTEDQDED
jgi:hypothetical protein